MIDDKMKKQYAEKWKLNEDVVFTVYRMIQDAGRKYGKVSKTLKSFGIILPPRQLKYFYRKIKLNERIQLEKKGRPKNYPNMLRKTA